MYLEPLMVLTCKASDFDAVTHTCAAPFYSEQVTSLPTMTVEDAQAIGLAVALLWATAYVFRMLKRALNEIG